MRRRRQVVGFICGGAERTGQLKCDGELHAIYMLQIAQRQGLGTLLVRRFVREFRSRGLTSMAVWVLALNPFRRFYEVLGGEVIVSPPGRPRGSSRRPGGLESTAGPRRICAGRNVLAVLLLALLLPPAQLASRDILTDALGSGTGRTRIQVDAALSVSAGPTGERKRESPQDES